MRTVQAVLALAKRGSVVPMLVRRSDSATGPVPARGALLVDPLTDPRRGDVVAHLLARRASRGLGLADAEQLALDPLYFADALVALGHVDGCVAGAVHTTAEVLRAALWTVGPTSGARTVSSSFYMIVPPFRSGEGEVPLRAIHGCSAGWSAGTGSRVAGSARSHKSMSGWFCGSRPANSACTAGCLGTP